ncbi:Trans-aconitate 2-methyltransferase [Shimia sp. SK013]|uniref:class I SAM-dependent DNA methyltransferase n=1 Tax=Shimia sp. SK013 TaxID=1389006 RepID=UPI0006B5E2D3|nr:methyltransferase domain-containing protein [Shimia sp. SK013]KPA22707.1 Trans-aconitate 2-methyltransferase [Shimia sp. SK013]
MTRKFLDNVYDHIGKGIETFYDDWADTYEAEVGENGYVTPARCARALAAHLADKAAPVLDFGCGTGLSGKALRANGLTTLDGMDLSKEMLAKARAKNLYRSLHQIAADTPLPFETGTYSAIAAIGVIGPGAAPLDLFDTLLAKLAPSGLFVLSFNDHALEDPAYAAKVTACAEAGSMRVLEQEHGPHLPARNINSTAYLLEKL